MLPPPPPPRPAPPPHRGTRDKAEGTMAARRSPGIKLTLSVYKMNQRSATLSCRSTSESRAGLQDNVPGRPFVKVESQLTTMPLNIKTITVIKKGGCTARVVTQSGTSVHHSGVSSTRLADFLPPWHQIGWDIVVRPGPELWAIMDCSAQGKDLRIPE